MSKLVARTLVWLLTALWVFTPATRALAEDVPVSKAASRLFSEGVRQLTSDSPDRYHRAYRNFKAAYADSPTWKILGNLGIVAHELERDGEALDAFARYLEEGGDAIPVEERAQVERDLELVRAGHATIELDIGPESSWVVDERLPESGSPVLNRYGPVAGPLVIGVRAGHHRVRAEREGFVNSTWEVLLEPGETQSHEFSLQPENDAASGAAASGELTRLDEPSESGGTGRVLAYASLGLAAVGAGVGTVFWLQARDAGGRADSSLESCLSQQFSNGDEATSCRETTAPHYDDGQTAQNEEATALTRATLSFGLAGAAVLTSTILFLVTSGGDAEDAEPADVSIVPWVGPGSLGIRGVF